MQTDEFEWDDAKAASNLIKHGVAFETATFAFDDPDGLDDVENSAKYGCDIRRKEPAFADHKCPRGHEK